jgi:excisionase family DNA binding protein
MLSHVTLNSGIIVLTSVGTHAERDYRAAGSENLPAIEIRMSYRQDMYMTEQKGKKKDMSKREAKPGSGEPPRQTAVQQLLLTVPEVARLLRLSEAKIYTMLEDRCPGGIPIKRFGRSLRISLQELRRWLEQQ